MVKNRVIGIISLVVMVLFLFPSALSGFESPGHDDNDLILPSSADDTILIEGDSAFNASNGISSGSGTANDPYILENKTIMVTDINGIKIVNTTKHLVISNCTITGGSSKWGLSSIYILNTSNVNISHTRIDQGFIGMDLNESSHIDIFDVVVNASRYGIIISDIDNITIEHSRFDTDRVGIHAVFGMDLKFSRSYCSNNSDYGMGLRDVERVRIDNNSLHTNSVGLAFGGTRSRNITVEYNNVRFNDRNGFTLSNDFYDVLIQSNNVSSNGWNGISTRDLSGSNIIFNDNLITHNEDYGIYFDGSNVLLTNNTISNNLRTGIYLNGESNYNLLCNNTIDSNGRNGITFEFFCNFNVVQFNSISRNNIGVYLQYSSRNDVIGNEIFLNGEGIRIYGPEYSNRIMRNEIHNNEHSGIFINYRNSFQDIINNSFFSNGNNDINIVGEQNNGTNILNNTFLNGSRIAVNIYEASNSSIYNNYFFGNKTSIYFQSCLNTDIWNNYFENSKIGYYRQDPEKIEWNISNKLDEVNIIGGTFTYGNYWSDYDGEDINGDGIGDTFLPHGPGDEGPLVKVVPPPDITPPTIVDLTQQKPQTGEIFNTNFMIQDDRNIFGMDINIHMKSYSDLLGLIDDEYRYEFELDENGSLNLPFEINDKVNYLILDINLTDFSGNTVYFTFNYTVEDIIPPWITSDWWEEDARSGENFSVSFSILDNINVEGSYIEYYYNEMTNDVGRLDPLPESIRIESPVFNISVGELIKKVSFRLVIFDINELGFISEWYTISVIDVTLPTIEDITGSPPKSNSEYHMRFKIYDNREVDSIEIVAVFDKDTEMEREETILKSGPFDDIWEIEISVPETSYTMTYTVTIWDKIRNENVLSKELEVIDSVLPVILDITTENPVTGNDYVLFFSISDNEEVDDGFFEYRYDGGPTVNISGIPVNIRIENILASALILNYRAGVKDLDGNWRIIGKALPVVDGTPPRIELHYGIPYTSHIFKVWVNATDNWKVWESSLKYSLDDDSAQIYALFPGPYFEIELPMDVVKLTLYGIAKDRSKNENVTTVDLEVLDGSPPIIDFKEAIIGPDGIISISFGCVDNREMGTVWVILIGEDGTIHNITGDEVDGSEQIIRFQKKGLGKQFNYSICAMDAGGNVVSTQERTMILTQGENGSSSYFLVVLLIIMILLIAVIAIVVVIIMRSRSESRENQVEIEKIKEVFDHFEVGTRRKDMDCYKVLGVPNSATVQEITRSYRELALVHHPDMIGNGASVDDAEMKRINCAKAILIDPEKRAILDRYLGFR